MPEEDRWNKEDTVEIYVKESDLSYFSKVWDEDDGLHKNDRTEDELMEKYIELNPPGGVLRTYDLPFKIRHLFNSITPLKGKE
jgi:hypothetical protein